MAHSAIAKVIEDSTIVLSDLADAHTFTIAFEPGDFNTSIPSRTVLDIFDRNRFMTPRYGKDTKLTGSFSVHLCDLSDTTYATLVDIALWCGGRTNTSYVNSNWVSRYGASAEVKAVKLVWTVEGTSYGDASDHVNTIDYVVITSVGVSEGDPGKINISFESRNDPANT